MSYKIDFLETKPMYAATMKMTIPDYSMPLALKAVQAMEKELKRHNINLAKPNYNFYVSFDNEHRYEVIDIEVVVAVDKMGEEMDMIKFVSLPEEDNIIRVTADTFDDVHIGLAEWMHYNDYVADGILRTVIHDGDQFIYDCPVKPAED